MLKATISKIELLFSKNNKPFSDLLIKILEDYLSKADPKDLGDMPADSAKDIADALYELKLSPAKGFSPRCHIKLSTLFEIQKIVEKYSATGNSIPTRFLAVNLHDMYEKLSQMKYEG